MAALHHVQSFEELVKLTSTLEGKCDPIFVLFTGAKDAQGKSWCPDCESAEPVIEEAVKNDAPKNSHFITVSLQRDLWKDPQCVFRTDARLRLSYIPSLVRWPNSHLKLQMEQCASRDLLKMFFEENE